MVSDQDHSLGEPWQAVFSSEAWPSWLSILLAVATELGVSGTDQ